MSANKQASKNVTKQMLKLYGGGSSKASRYSRARIGAQTKGQVAPSLKTPRGKQVSVIQGAGDRKTARNILNEKTAMDTQLATAVFTRWNQGLPVAETSLHKAASALGINPDDALLEARFYTMLDHDLAKVASGHSLTPTDLNFYASAVGESGQNLVKTAHVHHLSPQDLVLEKLASQNWVPYLDGIKLAMGGMDPGGQGGMPTDGAGAAPGAEGAEAAMPAPEAGQEVQQAPQQRFKPSPMAPSQVPPSPGGNLQELARSAMSPSPPAQDMQAGMGVGGGQETDMAPSTPAPPPPTPEEKLQQVVPDLPPETAARYSEKMTEVEQQAGMPIEDPNQIQKFVAEMKKQDAKQIDEAIKGMAQAAPIRSAPAAGAQPAAPAPAPAPAAPATPAAQEKVAHVARLLARADYANPTHAGSSVNASSGALSAMSKEAISMDMIHRAGANAWKSARKIQSQGSSSKLKMNQRALKRSTVREAKAGMKGQGKQGAKEQVLKNAIRGKDKLQALRSGMPVEQFT
jgi:ribosomal protein L12E/L44/L45/RPP1/RPP2